jgi:hypothetical protein
MKAKYTVWKSVRREDGIWRNLRFTSRPGTLFILPRGTVDEVNWTGPTRRLAVAIHPHLLTNVLDETAHQTDVGSDILMDGGVTASYWFGELAPQ